MKITCQSCQSKYTVSDEKVQGKTVKIKCRKCGATILVNSGGVTTSAPADPVSLSSGGAADGGTSYLVNVAEGDQRSMTLPEIVAAYQTTVVTADTYVWADGMGDWQPLGQVDAIVAALNSPAAAAEVQTAEPAYAESAAEPEHRAAARRDPARGARGDLFGNRPAEESAGVGGYNGSSSGGGRPVPPAPASRGNEENSMLFSLSALTAKPSSASAPRATSARDREDSGIIDLKALAAAAAAQSAPSAAASASASAFMPDGGLFPLGAPIAAAPMAAPPVVSPSLPPPKSKTPIFLVLGGVVAVGAIVGAFMFMRGGPPPVPTPAAADTSASAAPTATVSAAPSATASADAVAAAASASAAADASAAAAASAAAKAGKAGKGGPVSKGGGPGKGGPAAPAAAAAAPAAPVAPVGPKKGNCGCAAGDLMCAMKCSAK